MVAGEKCLRILLSEWHLNCIFVNHHLSRKTIHDENWVYNFSILHYFKRQIKSSQESIFSHDGYFMFCLVLFYENITEKKDYNNNF